ncbi:hypothetical protein [Methylomonas sp. MgM2]
MVFLICPAFAQKTLAARFPPDNSTKKRAHAASKSLSNSNLTRFTGFADTFLAIVSRYQQSWKSSTPTFQLSRTAETAIIPEAITHHPKTIDFQGF